MRAERLSPKDNKIIAVGDASPEKQYKAEQVLDVDGDIVMPGLINTHTHVSTRFSVHWLMMFQIDYTATSSH